MPYTACKQPLSFFTIQKALKNESVLFCCIALLLCGSSCKTKTAKDSAVAAMNTVYQNYTEAIRSGRGKVALQYASKRTIAYHDSLIRHILYSGREDLKSLDLNHRLWVLIMRHSKPSGYWNEMTVEKWLLQMPEYDAGSGYYEQGASVGECRIENNNALCSQKRGTFNTGLPIVFTKEGDQWKIDIVTIKPGASEGLQEQMIKMKLSEEDYFFYLLKTIRKLPVEKEMLYQPLKQRLSDK